MVLTAIICFCSCQPSPASENSSDITEPPASSSESHIESSSADASSLETSSEEHSEESSQNAASSEATVSASEPAPAQKPIEPAPVTPPIEEAQPEPPQENVSASPEAENPKVPVKEETPVEIAPRAIQNDNSYLSDTEQIVINKINEERLALGLNALQYDPNLQTAARIRSKELCETNTWAHTRPNGDEWFTVVDVDVPISYIAAGENLAMFSSDNPNETTHKSGAYWFRQWKNSPSHYENIIRAEYTHVGVGIYYKKVNGVTYAYATTIFTKM